MIVLGQDLEDLLLETCVLYSRYQADITMDLHIIAAFRGVFVFVLLDGLNDTTVAAFLLSLSSYSCLVSSVLRIFLLLFTSFR